MLHRMFVCPSVLISLNAARWVSLWYGSSGRTIAVFVTSCEQTQIKPNGVSLGLFLSAVKQHAGNLSFAVEGKYIWSWIWVASFCLAPSSMGEGWVLSGTFCVFRGLCKYEAIGYMVILLPPHNSSLCTVEILKPCSEHCQTLWCGFLLSPCKMLSKMFGESQELFVMSQ